MSPPLRGQILPQRAADINRQQRADVRTSHICSTFCFICPQAVSLKKNKKKNKTDYSLNPAMWFKREWSAWTRLLTVSDPLLQALQPAAAQRCRPVSWPSRGARRPAVSAPWWDLISPTTPWSPKGKFISCKSAFQHARGPGLSLSTYRAINSVVSSPRLDSRYGRLGEADCASMLSTPGDMLCLCFSLLIQINKGDLTVVEAAVCISELDANLNLLKTFFFFF